MRLNAQANAVADKATKAAQLVKEVGENMAETAATARELEDAAEHKRQVEQRQKQ